MYKYNQSNQNNLISARFLQALLEIADEVLGQDAIREFNQVKANREKYLKEQWTDELQNLGNEIFREIDYDFFITLLQKKLDDSFEDLFDSRIQIVRTCFQFGEYHKARDILAQIEHSLEANGDEKRALLFMLKARLALLNKDLSNSQFYYKKALDWYTSLGDNEGKIKVYNNLGIIAFEQWETDLGRQYFEQAQNLVSDRSIQVDPSVEANIQMNLGIVTGMQGESGEARTIFEKLLGQLPETAKQTRLNVQINVGMASKDLEEFDVATQALSKALELAEEIPHQRSAGLAKLALADVGVRTANFNEAQQLVVDAFKIFSKLHDRGALADAYRVFGMLHREQEYFELSESEFEISIKINDEFGNLLNLTETYHEFSKLAHRRDDTNTQRNYLKKSLSYAESMRATARVERLQNQLDAL